jgi:hypothetical protein
LDLQLSPTLKFQYDIGRVIISTFYDDNVKNIPYSLIDQNSNAITKYEDEIKRGLSIASIDEMCEFLITKGLNNKEQVMPLRNFFDSMNTQSHRYEYNKFEDIFEIFKCISPESKPLFWKKLFVQEILYDSIQRSIDLDYFTYFHTKLLKSPFKNLNTRSSS